MPPKRKLLRRNAAREGELNLDTVAEERIDAVTCEPLKPGKFIEVVSPDGTLKLFYNTSTLVRVATDKGGFLQPPHFREPMAAHLVKQIEEIEGKKFTFAETTALNFVDGADEGGVHHQHQYFEDIMDEFYILNRAQVYVCPVCFGHYVQTRFIPQMTEQHRQIRYVDDGKTPVVDPLNVLSCMMTEIYPPTASGAHEVHASEDGEDDHDDAWDNMMVHVVFRNAAQWKAHMRLHHSVTGVAAEEYRLRQLLCLYYTQFNAQRQECGRAKRQFALDQHRYWRLSAGYNRLRYNRVVQEVENALPHPETVEKSAFPDENIGQDFNPVTVNQEEDDDFIDDEEQSEDYVPHYSPDTSEDDDEEVVELVDAPPRRSKRQRSPSSTSTSNSDSSDSDSDTDSGSESGNSSVQTASSSHDEEHDSSSTTSSAHQRQLYKRGLLKEHKHDPFFERMTAEERSFVRATDRAHYAPTQSTLYDPIMHRVDRDAPPSSDEIDWDNLGGAMPRRSTVVVQPAKTGKAPPPPRPAPIPLPVPVADKQKKDKQEEPGTPVTRLLLDDDGEEGFNANDSSALKKSGKKLLIDEDE